MAAKHVINGEKCHLWEATSCIPSNDTYANSVINGEKVIYGEDLSIAPYFGGSNPLACRIDAMAGRRSHAMKAAAAAGDCAVVLIAPE
jgi:hypothetical protein